MLFFSDLDSTLIYSNKYIKNMVGEEKKEIQLVERFNEKDISFMTRASIDMLKSLSEKILFIPTTTRSINQFKRIFLFHDEVPIKYAIVSNGGNILIDGVENKEWSKYIKKKLKEECVSKEEVIEKFKALKNKRGISEPKMADGLFYYFILDHSVFLKENIFLFSQWLEENNWKVFIQGRKLYFIPNCINKRDAMRYIANEFPERYIIAAGDSMIDFTMFEKANLFISPFHGEINRNNINPRDHLIITKKTGIFASEEILENIHEIFKKTS